MKRVLLIFVVILLSGITQIYSQAISPKKARPTITIPKISNPPIIDGCLDDVCWSRATKITDFYKYRPVDGEPASEKTEVFVAYDREYFYVAFRCYERDINKIRANFAKRDDIFQDNRVGIILDTYNSQRRAYYFENNPLGIQSDALWVEGGDWFESFNFDSFYYSAGKLNSEGYAVEFAIPFKSMRFPTSKIHTVGFGLYRGIPETAQGREFSIWPPRSRSKNTFIDQLAQITGIEGIEYSKNIELLPSFTTLQTGGINSEGIFENSSPDSDFGLGLKYSITPNITVDFAYNPDFSQVEADVGQVDINQRYELYYEEKRPFFLEGADIFRTDIEAFYSRRVIAPLLGAKITGKIGKATFGFLSALDEGPGREFRDRDNPYLGEKALFNIFRGSYDLFGNSYIGFLMTSRQFADSSNQVVGIDSSFNFKQKYRLSFQGLESFTTTEEGEKLKAPAFLIDFSRNSRHLTYTLSYRDFHPDF